MCAPVHRPATTAALMVALGWSLPVAAFGPSGHRLAGHIAERHLCTETRAALEPLLAGMTLADAGVWPDTIRRHPEWDYTKPWHYLNVSDHGSVAGAASRGPDNVIAALGRFERELADSSLSNQSRGLALRFVAHFVVDLHQPLHVGRASDRGGNLIAVRVAGQETTLHAVWDGELLRLPHAGDSGVDGSRLPHPTAAEAARWQRSGPVDWARESQALRPQVYGFAHPETGPAALPSAYLDKARAVVDRRLVQAGVRLAGRLNVIFGAPLDCGAKVATR